MARDPGSVWAPLPEAGAPDGYRKDKFIVHSTGANGTARGTRNYFAQAGTVTESTFIVGTGPQDPTLQLMDSTDNADANVAANQSGISVEVVGDGYGGYSAWQRSEIIRLGRWAAANHPIARQIVPTPTGSGFGWHIMFGSPGPWTTVIKICPGPIRIRELKADIFPAIFAGGAQEDDMPDPKDLWDYELHHAGDEPAGNVLGGAFRRLKTMEDNTLPAIMKALSELKAAIAKLQPPGS